MTRPPAYTQPRTLSEPDFRWLLRKHPEWLGPNITVMPEYPGHNIRLKDEATLAVLPACNFPSGISIQECPNLKRIEPGIKLGASAAGKSLLCHSYLQIESLEVTACGSVEVRSETLRVLKVNAENTGSDPTVKLDGGGQEVEVTGRIRGQASFINCTIKHLGVGLTLEGDTRAVSLILSKCRVGLLDVKTPNHEIRLAETPVGFRTATTCFKNMEILDGCRVQRDMAVFVTQPEPEALATELDLI